MDYAIQNFEINDFESGYVEKEKDFNSGFSDWKNAAKYPIDGRLGIHAAKLCHMGNEANRPWSAL
jgi:hypothetical protein